MKNEILELICRQNEDKDLESLSNVTFDKLCAKLPRKTSPQAIESCDEEHTAVLGRPQLLPE